MGHCKGLAIMTGKWPPCCFLKNCFLGLIMFAAMTYQEEPETGMLCISDCTTCPVICSPPPPSSTESHPPQSPPAHHALPPQTYYTFSPPPPTPTSPPPESPPPPLPKKSPQSQPMTPPPSPSWYYIFGSPPPPYKGNNGPPSVPVTVVPSGPGGPHEYPYPYYDVYASEASSLCVHVCCLFTLFLFQFVLSFW